MEKTEETYVHAPEVAERLSWLRGQLLSWFGGKGRSFPWRDHGRAPYEVAIAEILLQRTTAAGVARVYPGLIERYPSWETLVQAPLEDLERALRPLGLWRQKAQAFQRLAQSLKEHGGVIPRSRAELEDLRGIGPYTASALLAVVYGQDEPLLDVNMARLLDRFFERPADAGVGRDRSLNQLARHLVNGECSLQVNWAVLDFGALVCKARRPRCQECQLQSKCQHTLSRATPTSNTLSG